MRQKTKRIQLVYIIYWILLAYIIAALVFWFTVLSKQNQQMTLFKLERLNPSAENFTQKIAEIKKERALKTAQYIGEGSTFLILILAGAVFVFRSVRRQLRLSQEQQNFMIAITHELKTPIAVTKLNLETLQKRKLEFAQQQKLITNSLEETNRLNNLCDNLLLSSQLQSNVYGMVSEELNWSELMETHVREFKERYPQREIISLIDEDIWVNGDSFLLGMVANNLLDNALKYAPRDQPITVHIKSEDGAASFSVCDLGSGIEEEEKKKLFTKFYRLGNEATKKAKGTGLGLFLCKKIMESHNGKIFIENNEPQGSCFICKMQSVKVTV